MQQVTAIEMVGQPGDEQNGETDFERMPISQGQARVAKAFSRKSRLISAKNRSM